MEKFNFIREGMIKLPPGFRFQPTDEELVFEFLKRKVFSWPLPAFIIPEINVCKYDPWDLPGDMEQERYFFSHKEAKYPNGNRTNRATASGYWKTTGLDRQIGSASSRNHIIGMKKTLVFYIGKTPNASRTDWIMHEYRLVSLGIFQPTNNSPQNSFNQLEKWVLCRIFLKKKNSEIIETNNSKDNIVNNNNNVGVTQPRFYYSMARDKIVFYSVSSSSNCSSITDDTSSSGEDFDDESSSSHNFF